MRNYCIYFLIDNGEVVYIGQTGQLKIRLRQHSGKSYSSVRFIPCDKESLNYYESRWINRFKPRYNGPAIPCKRKAIDGNAASTEDEVEFCVIMYRAFRNKFVLKICHDGVK